MSDRIGALSDSHESVGEVVLHIGIVRIELLRSLQFGQRIGGPARLEKGDSQEGMHRRVVGINPERVVEMSDGFKGPPLFVKGFTEVLFSNSIVGSIAMLTRRALCL